MVVQQLCPDIGKNKKKKKKCAIVHTNEYRWCISNCSRWNDPENWENIFWMDDIYKSPAKKG